MTAHSLPEVIAAVRGQAGRFLHTSTCYLIEPAIELAEKIAVVARCPMPRCSSSRRGPKPTRRRSCLPVRRGDPSKRPAAAAATAALEGCRRRGVIIGNGGLYGNMLRLAPPMTITLDEADEALTVIEEALADCGGVAS